MTALSVCFVAIGVPLTVKTAERLSHVSKAVFFFFKLWNIKHVADISYNPQGCAVVAHVHLPLKHIHESKREVYSYLHEGIRSCSFTLNALNPLAESKSTSSDLHGQKCDAVEKPQAPVLGQDVPPGESGGPV